MLLVVWRNQQERNSKAKPLAYEKDLKNYINRFNLGHSSEAKRVLEWVSDYSSSESYTGSDSDYYSKTNSLPDTNYYKMPNSQV